MQKSEAEEYLNKPVRIILTNRFHFTGIVLNVSETSLILLDKFNERITLNLPDIMICSGGSNG